MQPFQAQRERFADGGLATASGPKIIVMCYERLDRDLGGGLDAIAARDIYTAHQLLCHAQDIVFELLCMLDLDAWEHSIDLARIYGYVLELLTKANVDKTANANKATKTVKEARMLLASLGDGFRQAAALSVTAQTAAQIAAAQAGPAGGARELSLRA
jgi:flagellar secretion chaperone FliS